VLGFAAQVPAQLIDQGSQDLAKQAVSDQEWNSLQSLVVAGDSRLDLSADSASREVTRAKQQGEFLTLAEEARKFQADYPTDGRRKAAKVLEARNLLKAALVGDQTQRARAFTLADELKGDLALNSAERFDVAFLEQQVLVRAFAGSRTEYFSAAAAAARQLIATYPDQAGGYAWLLLSTKELRDDEQLVVAAQESLRPDAPFRARAEATVILERLNLVGKSLANFANTALGRDNFFEQSRTRRTVLYTWNAQDPDSIAWAADLERQIPDGVFVIGVCLSSGVAIAKDVASRMSLSSSQYYSEGGAGSFLALRLKLAQPGLIYVTDSTGLVTSVTAREDNFVSFLRN
jgi:hypothetical protein